MALPPHLPRDGQPSPTSGYLDLVFYDGRPGILAIHLSRHDVQLLAGSCVTAAVSLASVLALIFYLVGSAVAPGRGDRGARGRAVKAFLRSDLGVYLILMLVGDVVAHFASLLNVGWFGNFLIFPSPLCTFQGAAVHFGFMFSALTNLTIAIQTWVMLVPKWRVPPSVKYVVVSTILALCIMVTIIGPLTNTTKELGFFGPTAASCWMTFGTSNFDVWFTAAPIILFVVMGVMTVSYFSVFIHLSGFRFPGMNLSAPSMRSGEEGVDAIPEARVLSKAVVTAARKMVLFPCIYCIVTAPLLITLVYAQTTGKILALEVSVACTVLSQLSGLADVILFLVTRKALIVARSGQTSAGTVGGTIKMTVQKRTVTSEPFVDSYADLTAFPSEPAGYSSGEDRNSMEKSVWSTTKTHSTNY